MSVPPAPEPERDRFRFRWTATAWVALAGAYVFIGLVSGVQSHLAFDSPLGIVIGRRVMQALVWTPFTVVVAEVTWWGTWRFGMAGQVALHALVGCLTVLVVNVFQSSFVLIGPPLWAETSWVFTLQEGITQSGLMGFVWYALLVVGAIAVEVRAVPPHPGEPGYVTTLEIKERKSMHRVATADVEWIEGAGDYALIHTEERDYLLHERMKTLESRLDPKYFARVHRSAIVNLREVTSYTSVRHGDCELVLRSGDVVRLTRTRRARVVERLSALGVETT